MYLLSIIIPSLVHYELFSEKYETIRHNGNARVEYYYSVYMYTVYSTYCLYVGNTELLNNLL